MLETFIELIVILVLFYWLTFAFVTIENRSEKSTVKLQEKEPKCSNGKFIVSSPNNERVITCNVSYNSIKKAVSRKLIDWYIRKKVKHYKSAKTSTSHPVDKEVGSSKVKISKNEKKTTYGTQTSLIFDEKVSSNNENELLSTKTEKKESMPSLTNNSFRCCEKVGEILEILTEPSNSNVTKVTESLLNSYKSEDERLEEILEENVQEKTSSITDSVSLHKIIFDNLIRLEFELELKEDRLSSENVREKSKLLRSLANKLMNELDAYDGERNRIKNTNYEEEVFQRDVIREPLPTISEKDISSSSLTMDDIKDDSLVFLPRNPSSQKCEEVGNTSQNDCTNVENSYSKSIRNIKNVLKEKLEKLFQTGHQNPYGGVYVAQMAKVQPIFTGSLPNISDQKQLTNYPTYIIYNNRIEDCEKDNFCKTLSYETLENNVKILQENINDSQVDLFQPLNDPKLRLKPKSRSKLQKAMN